MITDDTRPPRNPRAAAVPRTPRSPGRAAAPPPRPLDAADHALVELLAIDGRMPNAELARRVGLPESTCAGRVRALREGGVVTAIRGEVDL
ncbi:MAG TPA: AsnC family transcriptional regulator, partial [Ornithinibacter sp.]|nr:AsnC family transcriptional regulator [Ornithinibacter sp.]